MNGREDEKKAELYVICYKGEHASLPLLSLPMKYELAEDLSQDQLEYIQKMNKPKICHEKVIIQKLYLSQEDFYKFHEVHVNSKDKVAKFLEINEKARPDNQKDDVKVCHDDQRKKRKLPDKLNSISTANASSFWGAKDLCQKNQERKSGKKTYEWQPKNSRKPG